MATLPVGALAAFSVAAVTTPLHGSHTADQVVFVLLALVVAASALIARRSTVVLVALVAGLSFDFFHVEPIRVLHLGSVVPVAFAYVFLGLAVSTRSPR